MLCRSISAVGHRLSVITDSQRSLRVISKWFLVCFHFYSFSIGFVCTVSQTHQIVTAIAKLWLNVYNRLPSVLWRCWLGGRKGICPVKNEWWGAGVVICLERCADLHMAQLMPLPLTVSCFSNIQIGFSFLVPAHPGSPGKRAVKWVFMFTTDVSSVTLQSLGCNERNRIESNHFWHWIEWIVFFSDESSITSLNCLSALWF